MSNLSQFSIKMLNHFETETIILFFVFVVVVVIYRIIDGLVEEGLVKSFKTVVQHEELSQSVSGL